MAQAYNASTAQQKYVLRLLADALRIGAGYERVFSESEDGTFWLAELLADLERLRGSVSFDLDLPLRNVEFISVRDLTRAELARLMRDIASGAD